MSESERESKEEKAGENDEIEETTIRVEGNDEGGKMK